MCLCRGKEEVILLKNSLFYFFFLLITTASFKAGKFNITTANPRLFACGDVLFAVPFHGRQEVKILASLGHWERKPGQTNGAAIWVESSKNNGFRVCILEYGEGSNRTAELNWVALQSAPPGAQVGSTSMKSWTTGTVCKKIGFKQVRNYYSESLTCFGHSDICFLLIFNHSLNPESVIFLWKRLIKIAYITSSPTAENKPMKKAHSNNRSRVSFLRFKRAQDEFLPIICVIESR